MRVWDTFETFMLPMIFFQLKYYIIFAICLWSQDYKTRSCEAVKTVTFSLEAPGQELMLLSLFSSVSAAWGRVRGLHFTRINH